MEVVLFVIHADEALGDEAVAEYLVADRAIAAEEVAVAVRGWWHGEVETNSSNLPAHQPAGDVETAVHGIDTAKITGCDVLLEVAAEPERARGTAACRPLLLHRRLAQDIRGPRRR
jgi:hypothetical protein